MARAPALSIAIAEKRYPGEQTALFSGLQLDIEPGTVLAVLGPSGVGKSSLLRLLAGADGGFSGQIRVGGVSAAEAGPPGFVFQDARLLPWLSVRDNVRLVRPELDDAAVGSLLERVGLAGQEDRWPGQLSGGMQRRVALARALATGSGLLMLDEPFVSLDRDLVIEMRALLARTLAATGVTTVLVTHLIEDAALLADRIVVLDGRPARIAADLAIDTPRGDRDGSTILDIERRIAERSAR
ncbi:MAG: ABC transporter ATP-binding protein [Devosia sp.]|uniref:ABC transporter ATP-binding protein n=1 Tax=Devosia sp. TaxID=1871048 RepID=UPI0024CA9BA6|nr:ABC transporter ATP-binding protein [Devosia sp.]UYN98210.1 MAG: ABC transporter ATP-binding protein [Devosia sp.]